MQAVTLLALEFVGWKFIRPGARVINKLSE